MSTTCNWCNLVCKSSGGLTKHSKACKQRAAGLQQITEASRKRHEEEAEIRMIELEEMRAKRTRMEERENNWVAHMLSDRVSACTILLSLTSTMACNARQSARLYFETRYDN